MLILVIRLFNMLINMTKEQLQHLARIRGEYEMEEIYDEMESQASCRQFSANYEYLSNARFCMDDRGSLRAVERFV